MTRRAFVGEGQLAFPLPAGMVRPAQPPRRALPIRTAAAARPVRAAGGPRSRRLVLEVERVRSPRGEGLRLRSPRMTGWAAVAYTPVELARAVAAAQREADIAAYARWRGSSYDTPEAMEQGQRPVPPRAPRGSSGEPERPRSQLPAGAPWGTQRRMLRPDVADPADWTVLPNGRLQAPARGGKKPLTYAPDSTMGRRVLERRRAAGLPTAA